MRILWIDPGETSGFVVFDTDKFCVVEDGTLEAGSDFYVGVYSRVRSVDLVGCEDYLIYAHKAQAQVWTRPVAIELIGVVKYICYDLNTPLHFHRAIERTFFGSERDPKKYAVGNSRLRLLGFWLANKHARDAMRHVLTYLFRQDNPILLGLLEGVQAQLLSDSAEARKRSRGKA